MKNIGSISKQKANEIQSTYEMKYAINDLCILLASKNELFEENSLFYNRLIEDNVNCLKALEEFWNKCKMDYKIDLKEGEEIYLDFYTGELMIRNI